MKKKKKKKKRGPGRPKIYKQVTYAKVARLRRDRYTWEEIAKKLGCGRMTVIRTWEKGKAKEVEMAITKSCPFYAHAMQRLTAGPWIIILNEGSNQCALISDAHSPCVMQVQMNKEPDWGTCPRNLARVSRVVSEMARQQNVSPEMVTRQAVAMYQLVREGRARLTTIDDGVELSSEMGVGDDGEEGEA